ncbi:anthranilate phosphoribosyltransferase [Sphingosinicella terrae]|uniref:anthranilate phosphoribosyltransferase n=1 Tax=Sphingosinicella terrae TaxID=2172047 RepID=UPI0025486910|nr:anthranilate phosphoribosyltransferase [Sphingosinicella terrae]
MYMNNLAEPLPAPALEDNGEEALAGLFDGADLSERSATRLFTELVEGRMAEPAIAAMLVALRLKGETVDELIGAARALRAADSDFERPDYLFADSCGTGGDGSGSINISTAVAFVAAAAGLPVAKHGNRSFTSRCGSADVLEQLGIKVDVPASVSRRALDETGICFLFAPLYHPGLRHAGPARRALKVRTIMNVLGPCVNPAEPPVQLLGVADPALIEPVASTLLALGTRHALVVHGSGLDEVALHGPTDAARIRDGRIERLTLTPEEAGLSRSPFNAVKGGDPQENAQRLAVLLRGRGAAAETEAVAINAGALLLTAGLAASLGEAVTIALDTIASGEPFRRVEALAEATHA